MSFAERAHQQYRAGQHEEALKLYTEALAHASFNFQKIALHSNMAACYLKLRNLKKAAEECSSVLELDRKHVGALMLRVHILVALKDYHSALFDVHRLMEITPSSEMYRSLEARLRTQLSLPPIPEGEEEPSVSEVEMENTTSATEKSHTPSPSSQNTRKKSSASKSSALVPSSHSSAELTKTGWDSIPKPRGHSGLDYSRWDQVETDSSGEEEEEEDPQPQYLFRVRAVGVRPIK